MTERGEGKLRFAELLTCYNLSIVFHLPASSHVALLEQFKAVETYIGAIWQPAVSWARLLLLSVKRI